ncbi:MAG: hypothetical protein COB33_015570 [Thiotrichaceae bacterium]|nr:hypothetical protein [Thiotrichaceae bacterium]
MLTSYTRYGKHVIAVTSIQDKLILGNARMGFTVNQTNIKNSLGLSTKSMLHQWKQQPGRVVSIPGFERNYKNVARLSRTLRGAGVVGIALDVGQSGLKIHEACTVGADQSCGKASESEGGRLVGSVGGGVGGGVLGPYVACSLVFGIQTAGTSLLWCGIVAGVAGGYFGGKYGGVGGEMAGDTLYEAVYQ